MTSPSADPAARLAADQQLAESLAIEAGQLLLEIRDTESARGRALGDIGDRRSNELLLARLAAERPGDAVLSEESPDESARGEADRVWIIDPVDGTREFSMPGHNDWAVHVALWLRDGDQDRSRLDVSAVSLPGLGFVIGTGGASTFAGEPVSLEPSAAVGGLLDPLDDAARPTIVASGSRPPKFLAPVVKALGGTQLAVGSAGAKAMCVVRGEADAYVHAGGQFQWDSAAPAGVAMAHGFAACRIDGSPLEYNVADTFLPDLIICRPELRDPIVEAIAAHR